MSHKCVCLCVCDQYTDLADGLDYRLTLWNEPLLPVAATEVTNDDTAAFIGWGRDFAVDSLPFIGGTLRWDPDIEFSCPMLSSIIGPCSRIAPTSTLSGHAGTSWKRTDFLSPTGRHIHQTYQTGCSGLVPVPVSQNSRQPQVALLEELTNISKTLIDNLVMFKGFQCITPCVHTTR